MSYQTTGTNPMPCGYRELYPEMEALLAEYLEDGKRKRLQESSIHLHDKIDTTFYPLWLTQAAQRRRQ